MRGRSCRFQPILSQTLAVGPKTSQSGWLYAWLHVRESEGFADWSSATNKQHPAWFVRRKNLAGCGGNSYLTYRFVLDHKLTGYGCDTAICVVNMLLAELHHNCAKAFPLFMTQEESAVFEAVVKVHTQHTTVMHVLARTSISIWMWLKKWTSEILALATPPHHVPTLAFTPTPTSFSIAVPILSLDRVGLQ